MENHNIKEKARSQSLNLSSRSMSAHSDLNQPLNAYPTMNNTFPTSLGTEGHYCTLDDDFSPVPEYDMDNAFITDHRERDRIRQRACVGNY